MEKGHAVEYPTTPQSSETARQKTFVDRRSFLQAGAAAVVGASTFVDAGAQENPAKPTQFQIACMTLPYSQFPLARALTGIKAAGYEYDAWGTSHRESEGAQRTPVIAADAPPAKAKRTWATLS